MNPKGLVMTQLKVSYSQEDIQQILNLAIARQVDEENAMEFSRDQLLEIATEMGIPLATLNSAEKDWQQNKGMLLRRQDFDTYRKSRFHRGVFRYCVVNVPLMLLAIWFFSLSNPFSIFLGSIAIGGIVLRGLSLTLQYWDTYKLSGEAYEQAFQNWYRGYQARYLLNRWAGKIGKLLGAS
jgi:hypothetical protein